MAKERVVMLSTKDNPYNPIDNFELWNQFDCLKGYNSCGLLARVAVYSEAMTDSEELEETERAINEIIRLDLTNNFIKVEGFEESPVD